MGQAHLRLATAAAVASCVFAGAAAAADLDYGRGPGRYATLPPPEPYLKIERWTGFYIGGTLGYGWGDGRTGGAIGNNAFEQSGTLGTIHAGFNWQLGPTVLGLEADIGTGDLGSRDPTGAGTLRTSLNAIGSFRGRAGFLLTPALLLYGTAGLAWADMDFALAGDRPRSETFLGYQVGIGAEYMMSDRITLRLEGLHTGFDAERVIHSGMSNSFEPDFNTVRAGISFKF